MRNPNEKTKVTEDIFELTQEGSTNPSASFVKKLEGELVEKFSTDSNQKSNINFWKIMTRIQKIALASVGALVVAVGGYLTYGYMYPPIDADDLLSKIAAANANNDSRAKLGAPSPASAESTMSADLAIWRGNMKSYTESEYLSIKGPASTKCEMYGFNSMVTSAEALKGVKSSYKSFYKDGESYYEDRLETADGRLVSYSLTLGNKYYSYIGGKYAVLTIYPENNQYKIMPMVDEPVSATGENQTTTGETSENVESETPEVIVTEGSEEGQPTEPGMPVEPSDPDNAPIEPAPVDPVEPEPTEPEPFDPKEFFGEDVKVIGTDKVNGRDVYVLEYSTSLYCGNDAVAYDSPVSSKMMVDEENAQKGVIRQFVDKETYQYLRTETYLDSFKENNLVSTEESKFTEKEISVNDAKKIFVWDLNVPVKTYEMPSFDNESLAVIDMLKANRKPVFAVDGNVVTSIYSATLWDTPESRYTFARDFYPNGSLGDAAYKEVATNAASYPSGYYNLNGGDDKFTTYYSLSVYDKADKAKVFESNGFKDVKFTDTTVKVDGKSVVAKFADQSSQYGVTEPSVGGGVDDVKPDSIQPRIDSEEYKSYTYIVEYNDYYIVISGSVEVTSITGIDLSIASAYQTLVNQIEKYNQDNAYSPEIAY